MMVRISILALAFGLGSLTDPSSSSSLLVSAQHLSSEETNAPQRRRRLKPNDNVGEKIKEDHAKGSKSAKFTIATKIDVGSDGAGSELDLDVMELESAVTDDTIIEIRDEADGTERSISSVSERFGEDSLATILATDPSSADGHDGTFALLAVDLKNDEMHGFVDKKGKSKPFNIKQEKGSKGGKSMAEEETDEAALVAPDWSCGVHDEFEDSEAERRLDEHNHSHHDHHDHHHHDHDHQDDEDTAGIMESLSRQLRGANIKPIGKRVPGNRDLQTVYESTGIYDYQVDIYMEIDNSFITKTGGTLAKATNYINLLVSAANVIYEKEIHTHLHVSHIVVSTLYDSATGTSNALDKMRAAYASGSWHTPNIDLHHALLGNPLGGGIAYVGVLCDSNYGFGLTASISGNFVSLSNAVMWDLKAFAHEVGHNFGSGHTHEAYDPVIDACGTTCPGGTGSKWSTLMSYCHLCSGSYNNIMYTFGGLYDGSGTKSDINNWFDKPELMANASPGRTSVDPRRESHRMYNHARTRSNNCLARADPTPQPTPQPTFSPKPTVFQVPVIDATYDSTLKVPKCSLVGGGCDSKSLLVGRSSKGPEPNQPNTIASSCADGTAGGFHSDESNDSIKVVSVGGGALTEGTEVKIEATVWAWSASSDHVDFWYTSNVNGAATSWTLINTVSPTTSGALNTVSATYTLPAGGLQAVRVVMRYQGSATACPGGTYDDADDLVFAVGSDNSNPSPPTSNPTPGPTPSPTSSPTNPPTPPPTNAPINPPTNQPTPLPTNAPINPPTNQPTPLPTSSPTNLPTVAVTTATPTPPPTRSPTNAPTPPPVTTTTPPPTSSPTNAPTPPPTSSPTNAPTPPPTSSPTNIPTAIPTSNPGSTGGGPQIAVFDGVFPAPRCANVGNLCDSQELLTGRSTKGPELNHPNTFGSCPDGASGSFHSDESLDKIVVRSGGLDGTGSEVDFVEGGLVTIIASVWAWGTGGSDRADFYYASDASNPNWVLIGTEIPTAGGAQVLKRSYTLPAGGTQAVRVNFRYSGTQSPCSNGAYDDRDDLVFAVGSAGPPAPTGEPTSYPTWSPTDGPTPSPIIFSSGPQLATFDSLLGAPKCSFGSQCDSADLLIGRGTMGGGNEINRPNTLDNCADGNSGSFHGDESLDKIVVRSGEVDGTGSGVDLTEGGRATIIASVWAWSTGTSDRADFYYASEASSTPTWVYIGTEIPPAGGAQDLKRAYTIPSGGIQAVRVNFRYGGSVASSCNSGSYNDRDDLVFAVISNPSFSGDVIMGSDLPNPNGDVIVDAGRPTEDGRGDVIAEDVSPAEIEPKPEDPDGEEKKGKKEKGKKGKKD